MKIIKTSFFIIFLGISINSFTQINDTITIHLMNLNGLNLPFGLVDLKDSTTITDINGELQISQQHIDKISFESFKVLGYKLVGSYETVGNKFFVLDFQSDSLAQTTDSLILRNWINIKNDFEVYYAKSKQNYRLSEYRELKLLEVDQFENRATWEKGINHYVQKANLDYLQGIMQSVKVKEFDIQDSSGLLFSFFISNYQHLNHYKNEWKLDGNIIPNPFLNEIKPLNEIRAGKLKVYQFHFSEMNTNVIVYWDETEKMIKSLSISYQRNLGEADFYTKAIDFIIVKDLLLPEKLSKQTYFGSDTPKAMILRESRITENLIYKGMPITINKTRELPQLKTN